MRYILQVVLAIHICAMWVSKTVSRKVSWNIENVKKYVLQFACVMQTGINGYEIYKNVGMMHAAVVADRSPEAKNVQFISENENSKGLKKRKHSDRSGQKSDKSKSNVKKCFLLRPIGGQTSENVDRKCLK